MEVYLCVFNIGSGKYSWNYKTGFNFLNLNKYSTYLKTLMELFFYDK